MTKMGATGIIVHTPARVASQQAAVWAILLGLMLIWGVGFATPSALHNAAHDSRHGLAFPCH